MESPRDSQLARTASVIQSRQAAGNAARDRMLARATARESFQLDQLRRAMGNAR